MESAIEEVNRGYERPQYVIEFRSLKNYDSEAFLQDLHCVDFESAISSASGDPNQMGNNFYDFSHREPP